jgi:hypothetical protein
VAIPKHLLGFESRKYETLFEADYQNGGQETKRGSVPYRFNFVSERDKPEIEEIRM